MLFVTRELEAAQRKLRERVQQTDELPSQLQQESPSSKIVEVFPFRDMVSEFLERIPRLEPGEEVDAPVWALRWSQATFSKRFAFRQGHGNCQESMFKLLMQLMRGRLTPMQLTERNPLDAYVHLGPDGVHGLYSRDNRRLVDLMAFQACQLVAVMSSSRFGA